MARYDKLIYESGVDFKIGLKVDERVEVGLPETKLIYSGGAWLVDQEWSVGTMVIPIPTEVNPEPWVMERFVGAQYGSGDISVEKFQVVWADLDSFERDQIESDGCVKRAIPPKTLVMVITYPDVKTTIVTGEMGGEMLVDLTEEEKNDPEFMEAVDLLLGDDEKKRKAFVGQ